MPVATQWSLEQHSTSDRVITHQDKPLDNAFSRPITNLDSFSRPAKGVFFAAMAKHGRTTSVDKLLSRLKDLDSERKAIVNGIKAAIAHVMDGEAPFPLGAKKGKAKAQVTGAVATDRIGIEPIRKKRKMSAAGRAAIAAAQKARWAKFKKVAK